MSNGVRIEIRMTAEDCQKLDECAQLAKVDRSKLIRRLIELAHRDMLLAQRLAEVEQVTGAMQGSMMN